MRILLLLVALVLLPGAPARAGSDQAGADRRSISVVGEGEVSAAPDRAVLRLSVATQAKQAQAASQENARRSEAVLKALRPLLGAGDRAETAGYRIEPRYEYPQGGPRRLVGHRAVNSLRVETARLDGVGALLDAAAGAADVTVDSLAFELADPGAAQAEALQKAAGAARLRAEKVAAGLGVKLGAVRRAREPSVSVSPPPGPVRMATMEADAAPRTPILPGELRVRARVEVSFDIE